MVIDNAGNKIISAKFYGMKKSLFSLLFLVLLFSVNAQSAEDSVKAVINKMFLAMKNGTGNGEMLTACFADSAILQTIIEKEGKTKIITEDVKGFADFVNTSPKDDADERITFETVKVDGSLAIAWTPYNFYYKGKFSHCGIDSYQLVRINGEWKIQYLIDTRKKEGCKP